MNILGIIPARGGSTGIPGKNLKLLAGKPLIEYTIDASRQSGVVSRLILSTDSEEIAAAGRKNNVEVPFIRPAALADDNALMIDVVRHALTYLEEKENYKPDAVLILQPTSPLRTAVHLHEAVKDFNLHLPDTLVSVTKVPHNFIPDSIYTLSNGYLQPYLTRGGIYDRKLKPTYFGRNGPCILISSVKTIMESNSFYGEKIYPYLMEEESSIDIDTNFEFRLAELLLQDNAKQS